MSRSEEFEGSRLESLSNSNEPITIYRGIPEHPKKVQLGGFNIGRHWSYNKDSALSFATSHFKLLNLKNSALLFPPHGTVIEGTIHPSGLLVPGTDEWKEIGGGDYDSGSGIFHPDHEEAEATPRYPQNVTINALHHYVPGDDGKPVLHSTTHL